MEYTIDKTELYRKLLSARYKFGDYKNLKSASNLNGNLNGSKEFEHYAS